MRLLLGVLLLCTSIAAMSAEVGCDAGLYSRYINGINGVASTDREPVLQGGCRYTFDNKAYIDGWGSQTFRDPGSNVQFANELDFTIGIDRRYGKQWSADTYLAYYDLANPRLVKGSDGDLVSAGGTLRFHATETTRLYVTAEAVHGLGNNGFTGGWFGGIGAGTAIGPVLVDASLRHNQNFLGHGNFVKIRLETRDPIARLFGGEVRPRLDGYKPSASYGSTRPGHIVGAIRIAWNF